MANWIEKDLKLNNSKKMENEVTGKKEIDIIECID
jgi:hypothetical protein